MRFENRKLYTLVDKAIQLFSESMDMELIERGGLERSISFRLGYYLQRLLDQKTVWDDNWDDAIVVDAEFNKKGQQMKAVFQNCKFHLDKCYEGFACHIKSDKSMYKFREHNKNMSLYDFVKITSKEKYMIPDLILHKRMAEGNENGKNYNLLAIELKVNSNNCGQARDFAKLSYLTCPAAEYQYRLGLYLDFSNGNFSPHITAFENGNITVLPK